MINPNLYSENSVSPRGRRRCSCSYKSRDKWAELSYVTFVIKMTNMEQMHPMLVTQC